MLLDRMPVGQVDAVLSGELRKTRRPRKHIWGAHSRCAIEQTVAHRKHHGLNILKSDAGDMVAENNDFKRARKPLRRLVGDDKELGVPMSALDCRSIKHTTGRRLADGMSRDSEHAQLHALVNVRR